MIPHLEELSIGARIAIIIAIVALALLILAMVGYFGSEEAQGRPAEDLGILKHEEALLRLDREALERAYHDQIKHLFEVWMRDDTDQPRRAIVGAKKARKAFDDALTGIDEREIKFKAQQR